MLVKSSKAHSKKEWVSQGQIREAWRNDICLRQAMDRYRQFSNMTIEEVLDCIDEDIALGRDIVPRVNAVILRAAEVYREVTGRSPRTVGTDASTGPPLGNNPFITLITHLLEEEGLKSPSVFAITRLLRKKPISR